MAATTVHAGRPPGAPSRAATPAAGRRSRQAAAVVTLVGLAVLTYAGPALAGHPVVPGDDLTQNLPLRELVGHDLRAGHLPVFDPYIWSGTPLLAGWNAGAAYPLTWLFAILPGAAAWAVNLAAATAVAGVGCYAFLRASGLGIMASWLGGLTFAFGGGMVAQIPHIGLIAGMSWVPVALLSILRLSEPGAQVRARLRWTCALAASVGLVILAGEPRAIANAAVVLLLYGLWRLWRLAWRSRAREANAAHPDVWRRPAPTTRDAAWGAGRDAAWGAGGVVAGAALGVGLGAVQLLPGLSAVATSQRAQVTATLFSSGDLPVRWLLLLGVPDLLGGSGSFGQPPFFAPYSLTEVTGYVGILSLVAAGALLGRLRRGRPLPEWAIWYVIGAAGAVLALGTDTPLGHLLVHLPLFGGQRLQSRSILVTGLALAVLLAHWVDGWLTAPRTADGAGPGSTVRSRREAVLGTVLPVAVLGTVVAALSSGSAFFAWMGLSPDVARAEAPRIAPWLAPYLAVAALAVVVVWAGPHLAPRMRAGVAGAFVVADLALFVLLTVLAAGAPGSTPAPAPVSVATAASHAATSDLGGATRPLSTLHLPGRFAVFDPGLADKAQLAELGVPDGNAVAGTYSVQGYGSIVDGRYAAATGTHRLSGTGQNVLSLRALDDGTFDQLDTTTLLVAGSYLGRGDTALERALRPPHWLRAGHDGPFAIFHNAQARAPLTLRPLGATAPGGATATASGATVRRSSGPALEPSSARVSSPRGVEVVRAVADIPGWRATWRPEESTQAEVLPVVAAGVVQGVRVPAGSGTLSWRYEPPELALGGAVSLGSLAAVVLVVTAGWMSATIGRRERGRRRGLSRRRGLPRRLES